MLIYYSVQKQKCSFETIDQVMTSIFPFLLFSFMAAVAAQQRTLNISQGSSLSPTGNNTFWLSPSGLFAFGFYPKGNGFAIGIWFAITPQRTVVWTANRDDPPIPATAVIDLTTDGRLVLQQRGNQDKSIANTSRPATFASMLDSGNFVLYAADSSIIWRSFDHPTDTLLPGQFLLSQNRLVSSVSETNHSSGSFVLVMQSDGNLVMYPIDVITTRTSYWSTGTLTYGTNVTLKLDGDGSLFMLNSSGVNIKTIIEAGSSSKTYRLTLDTGGVLRLYSPNSALNFSWSVEWTSTDDVCQPLGVCGVNQYCDRVDEQPVCNCYPSYAPLNLGPTNMGCYRNFTPQTCVSIRGNPRYIMHRLDNIQWLIDGTYTILSSMTIDGCSQACLDDCNCEFAVFQNQECRKQVLPLRFGWKDNNSDVVTLFKTGVEGLVAPGNPSSDSVQRKRDKKLSNRVLISSIAFVSFALFFLAISTVLILKTYVFRSYNRISKEEKEKLTEGVTLREFTFEELHKATNGFAEELGRGAFGTVFKGVLWNNRKAIAVKRLEKLVDDGGVEFRNEMKSIGRTCHRNLVSLLGYCYDNNNKLLVYQYMSNGSLGNFLFKSKVKPSWQERIGAALSIARGIHYLHEECETQIIHCDINPNNILMDERHCPRISDFGLAKLMIAGQSRTMTEIRGTRGYVAPEWYKNKPITVKADVYSFGIVFLEIICCRRSVSLEVPEEEAVLADWVCNCFEDNELNKLGCANEVDQQTLHRMVSIALWCIQEDPSLRPSMKKVVYMLEGAVEIPVPPNEYSYSSVVSTVV